MRKLLRRLLLAFFLVVLFAVGGLYLWFRHWLGPGPNRTVVFVRYEKPTNLRSVLEDLQVKGVVKEAPPLDLYARWKGVERTVPVGTYRFTPGLDADAILQALRKPIRQMVRIPETNWALRTSHILEQKLVCTSDEYMTLVRHPQQFQKYVPFPLPKDSLEGYLYPDTYDLPPLLGAKQVVLRQLRNFKKRVWDGLNRPKELHRLLTVASMVQMEVAKKDEMAKVAGVVENRLKKGMKLQIDATVNYAIQKWRPLTLNDLRQTDSPFNTYRYTGLPPGPICSPTVDSIKAAQHPANHAYLYYVANPVTRYHMFASTMQAHEHNIAVRRKLLKVSGA